MIGLCFVIASVALVARWQNSLWTILYSLFFLFIGFSNERYSRVVFFKSKRGDLLIEKRKSVIALEKVKSEKCLIDLEREQLTSLIGNVAHDLKTPLQSIRMDLELLKVCIVDIFSKMVCTSSFPPKEDDDSNPLTILKSLNAACDFMTMAINRSLDFAKANGNIALVPVFETFNIVDELSISINVIRHLQSAVTIIINPIPLELRTYLISDKHWFSENLLCLLSNAVKYSTGGIVNVTIELILGTGATEENTCSNKSGEIIFVDTVRCSVEDTGIGLSEEARNSLFQPFKQAQRMAGGTGTSLTRNVFNINLVVLCYIHQLHFIQYIAVTSLIFNRLRVV